MSKGKLPRVKDCPYVHKVEEHSVAIKSIRGGKAFTVFCGICGSTGPLGLTKKSAIEKWNNRYVILLSEEAYNKALKKSEEKDD